MPIIDKTLLPKFMQVPELQGVFVGGCIERGDGSSFRAKAHAHIIRKSASSPEFDGFICIRSKKRLFQKNLLIHELAHILTNSGHTERMKNKMKEIRKQIK